MSLPQFPTIDPPFTREDVINQIISSIAMEELGLSHIINAEGEKLQYALGTIDGVTGPTEPLSMEDLLKLNESIQETLNSTMMNQFFLKEKLHKSLSASTLQGPAGPTGPTGLQGATGAPGPAPSFEMEAESIDSGKEPTADIVKDPDTPNQWNITLGIPKGEKAPVPTIEVGDVTAVTFGVTPEVLATETPTGVKFDFKVPAGPQGAPGLDGENGESAYQVAVDNGFVGSEEEWLASLRGETGPAGMQGAPGLDGQNGESAYQVAVDNGFVGSEEEWLASLRGATGPTGMQGAPGLDGENGDSAYQVAVDNGFVGSEEEWLKSLRGETGPLGPKGDPGPAGTFERGQDLFTASAKNGSEVVPFEGNLAFVSDSLEVTVEKGPSIRVENKTSPQFGGSIIPFSSRSGMVLQTNAGGNRKDIAIVGVGGYIPVDNTPNDPITLGRMVGAEHITFSMPYDGVFDGMAVYMTVTAAAFTTPAIFTTQLYYSDAPDNAFRKLTGAFIDLMVGTAAPIGTQRYDILENADIPVYKNTRLMVVVYANTPSTMSTPSAIVTGSLLFR